MKPLISTNVLPFSTSQYYLISIVVQTDLTLISFQQAGLSPQQPADAEEADEGGAVELARHDR